MDNTWNYFDTCLTASLKFGWPGRIQTKQNKTKLRFPIILIDLLTIDFGLSMFSFFLIALMSNAAFKEVDVALVHPTPTLTFCFVDNYVDVIYFLLATRSYPYFYK